MIRELIMAFLKGIKKEILFVTSRKTTLFLVMFFPIITMATFGGLYSQNLSQSISLAIYIDPSVYATSNQEANNPLSAKVDFIGEIGSDPNVNAISTNSLQETKELVLENVVDGAIVISKPDTKSPYNVNVLVDSTDWVQSAIIKGTTTYLINNLTNKISVAMIEKIWEKIVSQEEKTSKQLERVDAFLVEFQKTKQATSQIENTVDSINVEHVRSAIEKQKTDLQKMRNDLQNASTAQSSALASLNSFESNFNYYATATIAYSYDSKGTATPIKMPSYIGDYVKGQISAMRQSMQANQFAYDQAAAKVDSAIAGTEQIGRELDSADNYVKSFKDFVQKAKRLQDQTESDIKESRQLLFEINENIKNLKQYSPEFLAKPSNLTFEDAIEIPNLATNFFPMVLSLVTMFTGILLTAISIISEKKQNVIARLQTMPVRKSFLILQKLVGIFIIISTVQLILLIVGVVFFGVHIYGNFLQIPFGLMLVSTTFILMGLVIGSLSSNEPSAILGTLAIAFPMIFLSGLLVPIELMPSGFLVFKIINPLAASSTILVNFFIKNLLFVFSILEILCLVFIGFVSLIIGYLKYF